MQDLHVSKWFDRVEYKERVVLFDEADGMGYGTHVEIEREGKRVRFWGHYNMSFDKAFADFNTRFADIEKYREFSLV
jgi:hypothetical protein|tara:strand:+ start:108 stop:338 length:231 start_codon:yes stop_codon:yes gene_type:complete